MHYLSRIWVWAKGLFVSDLEYPDAALACPIRTVVLTVIIGLIALGWAVLVPFYVASRGGVFLPEHLQDTVEKDGLLKSRLTTDDYARWNEFLLRKKARQDQIENIREKVNAEKKPDIQAELLQQAARIREEQQTDKPPIVLIAWFRSPQMWLRPVEWMCLACLILLARPPGTVFPPRRNFVAGFLCFLIVYAGRFWPQLARNLWQTTSDLGRVVFAYPNWDIDGGSGILQEIDSILFTAGLLVLWSQWARYSNAMKQELLNNPTILEGEIRERAYKIWEQRRRPESTAEGAEQDWHKAAGELRFERINEDLARLSMVYVRWQVASLLLVVPFAFGTWFYYKIVGEYHDFRYLSSAVINHAMWGVSWIFLSLPLFTAWHHWHTVRMQALTELAASPPESQDVLKAIQELHPVPLWNLTVTIAGTFGTFLLPLLKLLLGQSF